jgi:hypothetical protein
MFINQLFIFALTLICSIFSLPNIENKSTKSKLIEKIHKIDLREREEIVGKLKANNLSDIEPKKHLGGMPFESDGSINKDFHKELFLSDHHELDDLDEDKVAKKLTIIFKK